MLMFESVLVRSATRSKKGSPPHTATKTRDGIPLLCDGGTRYDGIFVRSERRPVEQKKQLKSSKVKSRKTSNTSTAVLYSSCMPRVSLETGEKRDANLV